MSLSRRFKVDSLGGIWQQVRDNGGWTNLFELGKRNSIVSVKDIQEIKFDLNNYEVYNEPN